MQMVRLPKVSRTLRCVRLLLVFLPLGLFVLSPLVLLVGKGLFTGSRQLLDWRTIARLWWAVV